jgi:hypothetical protein
MQIVRSWHAGKEFPGPLFSILANGTLQASRIGRRGALQHSSKDLIPGFGQLIKVIDEIDEKEFVRQGSWKPRPDAKRELTIAQPKIAVPFVIVDDCFVIELRRADAKTIVRVRGSQQKCAILEEGADNLFIRRGRKAKDCFLGTGVQATRQLPESAVLNQLLEMPIDRRRPTRQVGAPVGVARFQMPLELFGLPHASKIAKNRMFASFFIEDSCKLKSNRLKNM